MDETVTINQSNFFLFFAEIGCMESKLGGKLLKFLLGKYIFFVIVSRHSSRDQTP